MSRKRKALNVSSPPRKKIKSDFDDVPVSVIQTHILPFLTKNEQGPLLDAFQGELKPTYLNISHKSKRFDIPSTVAHLILDLFTGYGRYSNDFLQDLKIPSTVKHVTCHDIKYDKAALPLLLPKLQNITSLEISDCHVLTNDDTALIGKMTTLETLVLDNCLYRHSDNGDNLFKLSLDGFDRLKKLHLFFAYTDVVLPPGTYPSLVDLKIRGKDVTTKILTRIATIPTLRRLDLSQSKIGALSALGPLTGLEKLTICRSVKSRWQLDVITRNVQLAHPVKTKPILPNLVIVLE